MNCSEALTLLSPYLDGELAPDVCTAVEQHIEGCPACAEEWADFRAISDLASRKPCPPSPQLWENLRRQLDSTRPAEPFFQERSHRAVVVKIAWIVAVLVFASFGGWLIRQENVPDEHDAHAALAVNFERYIDEFQRNADKAQQVFLDDYENETVNLQQASQKIGYRCVATEELPGRYVLSTAILFKMPCCLCLQAIYKQEGGATLAVFEHADDQPLQFGDHPALTCQCSGKSTRIIEFDSRLAATWRAGKRYTTLIGAHDIEELVQLVTHLVENSQGNDP